MLARALSPADRTEILGDLEEGFAARLQQIGDSGAHRWYRRQVAGVFWNLVRDRLRTSLSRRPSLSHGTRTGDSLLHRRWLDIRHAIRGFRRSPGFTITAVATIALGVAASTIVFAMVHSILLTPLPFPDPNRVVGIWHVATAFGQDQLPMSRGMYFVYGEHSRSLERIALYQPFRANVMVGDHPERLAVVSITHELFDILGATPVQGRLLIPEDDVVGSARVALLDYGLWSRAYGRDPSIVGDHIDIDGGAYEVIGVLPPEFRTPSGDADVFVAAQPDPTSPWTGGFNALGVARLADGATPASADAELAELFPIMAERFDNFSMEFVHEMQLRPELHRVMDDIVGTVRPALWTLLGTVGFVLLIACVNVANLILVRTEGRRREVALRRALGADQGAVAAAFFTESAAMATLGTMLGMGMAWAAIRLLVRFGPREIPRLEEVRIEPTVLLFCTGLAVLAAFIFGLIPVVRSRTHRMGDVLRAGTRGNTVGRNTQRLRTALVASQTAFALILLVGSGLLIKSFWQLRRVELGFTPERVLTFRVSLPGSTYPNGESRTAFYRTLLQRLEAIPGVLASGVTSRLPLDENNLAQDPLLEPGRTERHETIPWTGMLMASPDYFRTLNIPIVAGRGLTWTDVETRSGAVLVSETLARAYWPDEDPIGKRVRHTTGGPDTWSTVAGVVGEIRLRGITQPPGAEVYYALQPVDGAGNEWLSAAMSVSIRTGVPPLTVVPSVRAALREVAPNVAISSLQTMPSIVRAASAQAAFTMVVLAMAATIGLFMGGVGMYGVVAYITGQRMREIGVRMALGANRGRVQRMVMRQGTLVAGAGIVIGLAASLALTRLLRSQLYEVSPNDPWTFGMVTALLLGVSSLATYMPARRAARTDPTEALRAE
jgi:predicted permease